MLFYTHALIGIVGFLLLRDFFGDSVLLFFLVFFGSVLPDIDSRFSKVNRWAGFIGIFLTMIVKHRGVIHSLFFHVILGSVLWWWKGFFVGFALFYGYLLHVFADGFTRAGVKIFYPFSEFKIRGPFKAGGLMENFVLFGAAIFALVLLF